MPFTVTPSSNGEVAYRSQLPNEVAFESLASRLRPFTNTDGDIVRRGAFSKSLGSGTRRYRWSGCTRLMTHAAMSVMSSRPARPTTVWRSSAGLISTPSFGKSAYRNTKGRRASGLSIGYAIRNSKTAAGN